MKKLIWLDDYRNPTGKENTISLLNNFKKIWDIK